METTQPPASPQNETQNYRGNPPPSQLRHLSTPTPRLLLISSRIFLLAALLVHSLQVRYAAVVVLKEVYSRLGNEFTSLLPETIPFLAELLEGKQLPLDRGVCNDRCPFADESEDVEQETQSLISTIEQELGESIQQYFQ